MLQFENVDLREIGVSVWLINQLFVRVLKASPLSEKTVPMARATRVLAWATRCTALTAHVVVNTACAAVPANGATVATWTANAVRGLPFAAGRSASPETAQYQAVHFRDHHGRISPGTRPTAHAGERTIMCATKPSGSAATRAGGAVEVYRTVEQDGESNFSLTLL